MSLHSLPWIYFLMFTASLDQLVEWELPILDPLCFPKRVDQVVLQRLFPREYIRTYDPYCQITPDSTWSFCRSYRIKMFRFAFFRAWVDSSMYINSQFFDNVKEISSGFAGCIQLPFLSKGEGPWIPSAHTGRRVDRSAGWATSNRSNYKKRGDKESWRRWLDSVNRSSNGTRQSKLIWPLSFFQAVVSAASIDFVPGTTIVLDKNLEQHLL